VDSVKKASPRRKVASLRYRSGLEANLMKYLDTLKVAYTYETTKIEWEDLMYRKYTPDFILPNGIIVETKGMFDSDDRRKHEEIKRQHPELDIRFVFQRSKAKLSKASKTTYADWCDKRGFLWYEKVIPQEWLDEPGNVKHPALYAFPSQKITRK
jgi:hypothetical protein